MKAFTTVFLTALRRSKALMIVAVCLSVGLVFVGLLIVSQTEEYIGIIRVGLIDSDNSHVSTDLARYIEHDLDIEIEKTMGLDELKTELVDKRISAIIEIPMGLEAGLLTGEETPGIGLTVMGDYANEAFLRAYLNSYIESLNTLLAFSDGDVNTLAELLGEVNAGGIKVSTKDKNSEILRIQSERDSFGAIIGLYQIISFLLAIGLCNMFYADRKGGTFARVRASNVRATAYTTAMGLVGIVISLLVIALPLALVAITNLDTGVPMGVTVLATFVFSLFIIAFGMFAGLCMPSLDSIVALIVIVATITSMMGGAFFPLDTAPEFFKNFAIITPQYWFSDIMSSYRDGAGHWVENIVAILLMAAIFFILSGVRFVMKSTAKAS